MPLSDPPNRFAFHTGVTLMGAGPVEPADLRLAMTHAPQLVVADGGANRALELGHMPRLVIGDMDSLRQDAKAAIPDAHKIAVFDQDDTDFQKCLDRLSAPILLAVGFWGGRADHTMAAMHALAASDARCILLTPEDVIFSVPRRLRLNLAEGTRVSLFPMTRVTGRSTGLRWPIDDLILEPFVRIGTSNRATGPVSLDLDGQGMLMVLPRAWLEETIRVFRT